MGGQLNPLTPPLWYASDLLHCLTQNLTSTGQAAVASRFIVNTAEHSEINIDQTVELVACETVPVSTQMTHSR